MITKRLIRPLSAFSSTSWTCPACSRTSLLPRISQPVQRRSKHIVPPLRFDFQDRGIPNLLSPVGYEIAWLQYQGMMIDKLNTLLAGERWENSKPLDIVRQFARDPMNASVFNYASMASNNHFFFSGFSLKPQPLDQIPQLKTSLENAFGSIETLRMTMLDTADAMFGPGFVWLVWAYHPDENSSTAMSKKGDWRILTTYLAGTPYPEAGYRHQGLDMNTSNAATFDAYRAAEPVNNVGAFGPHSAAGKAQALIPPGATKVAPVLCVNTWSHVYHYDFGLLGKRKYLNDWWEAIDWSYVDNNQPANVRSPEYTPRSMSV